MALVGVVAATLALPADALAWGRQLWWRQLWSWRLRRWSLWRQGLRRGSLGGGGWGGRGFGRGPRAGVYVAGAIGAPTGAAHDGVMVGGATDAPITDGSDIGAITPVSPSHGQDGLGQGASVGECLRV